MIEVFAACVYSLDDNKEQQNENATFRQDSIDNVFSQGRKPFFVKSPANLSKYTFSFFLFLVFIFASLYLIKLPIHIKAIGEVLAGKDYHQIIINEDNKVVSQIDILEGQTVKQGQVLLQLDGRDKVLSKTQILDLSLQIQELEASFNSAREHHSAWLKNIIQQRKEQTMAVQQLTRELAAEKEILLRYQQNVKKGLTSALLEDAQTRVVSQTESNLLKEKSAFTKLDLTQLESTRQYQHQQDTSLAQIARLKVKIEQINQGIQILSPCDCLVDNIFIENGMPVIPGQSILTLSLARASSSLMLYVPASRYRNIDINKQIQVNVASYPSNKYGALKASVVKVSSSPVPGNMISKKGLDLQDTTYFVLKAVIDKVPSDITLTTGMAIESDIVVDQTSLFDLMFDFKTLFSPTENAN